MSNELGQFLRERRGSRSLRDFAAQCKISHTHLDSIEKGCDPRTGKPVSISTETLRQIATALNVDFVFLCCLADGYRPQDVTNAVIPLLSPEMKEAISKMTKPQHYTFPEDNPMDLTLHGNTTEESPTLSSEALKLARDYDSLDGQGKVVIRSLVDFVKKKGTVPSLPVVNLGQIRHYLTPAAAGYAAPIEGEDYEMIPVTDDMPKGADFCIDISGDSMEPYIKDGSRVYIQRGDVEEMRDAGVFFVDGDVFVKQWCMDPYGTLYLLSANPKREDANITIYRDSGRNVVCFGRVLLNKKLPDPIYHR